MLIFYHYHDSPIGKLLLTGHETALTQIFFSGTWKEKDTNNCVLDKSNFTLVITQLDEYFRGERQHFDITLDLKGTVFQKQVWQELSNIPYGTTTNYGEIAKNINNPNSCRAVGMANSKNPIPIIIPCHRVIGKNGTLTGFGGGLEIKQQLLELESKYRDS